MTDTIASAVATMLDGLADVARSLDAERRAHVLESLGVRTDGTDADLDAALDALVALSDGAASLADAVADGNAAAIVAATAAAADDLVAAAGRMNGLDLTATDATELFPGALAEVGPRLLQHVLLRMQADHVPLLDAAARLVGLVDSDTFTQEITDEDYEDPIAYSVDVVRADRLGLLADPAGLLVERTGWGQGGSVGPLLDDLRVLLRRAGLVADTVDNDHGGIDLVLGFGPAEQPLPATVTVTPTESGGVIIVASTDLDADTEVELGEFTTISFDVPDVPAVTVVLEPGQPIDVESLTSPARGGVSIVWSDPAGRLVLLRAGELLTVDAASVELSAGLTIDGNDIATDFAVAVDGLAVALGSGDADSFLASLLPPSIAATFDIGVAWTADGFRLNGGVAIVLDFPLNLALGPIDVQSMTLAIAFGEQLDLDVTFAVAARLGPIGISVGGVGVSSGLAVADGIGTLGPLTVATPTFKPPNRIGIDVEVGPVSGGGYLDIDTAAGTYRGVLELDAFGVGIAAVAIIDTDVPGVDGWSMFFALFLDLPTVQLGFGFTLNGVGGLGGVNRAVDIEALQSAVRSGALGSVLFPENPIDDAPMVISELEAIFPPAADTYVFGPVVKIGWGTPPIIEAELGIVIQVPAPIVIAVIGSVTAVLPSEDLELVAIRLDVAGVIDTGAGTLSIDASLHDSHVIGFALAGDMALRASFSDSRSFLMSLGGFHPAFDPPAGFPSLRRLSLGIDAGSVLSISFECYVALTSNTVQFGAAFALDAEVLGFGVSGGASFDALIQFSPFQLTTNVGFHVSIRAVGVDLAGVWLDASLTGPNPWHVVGTATFKVLMVEKDIRIDELIGAREPEPTPTAPDILDLLVTELERVENWQVIASGVAVGVMLGDAPAPAAGELVARPDAVLEVRQTLVPLGLRLDQFGNTSIGEHDTFTIDVGEGDLEPTGDVDDWFAVAQFLTLTAAEKLAAPSFETMTAGLRFGSAAIVADEGREASLEHTEYVLDPELPIDDPGQVLIRGTKTVRFTSEVPFVRTATTTTFGFRATGEDVVELGVPAYVLTDTETMEQSSTYTSWSAARQASTRTATPSDGRCHERPSLRSPATQASTGRDAVERALP